MLKNATALTTPTVKFFRPFLIAKKDWNICWKKNKNANSAAEGTEPTADILQLH